MLIFHFSDSIWSWRTWRWFGQFFLLCWWVSKLKYILKINSLLSVVQASKLFEVVCIKTIQLRLLKIIKTQLAPAVFKIAEAWLFYHFCSSERTSKTQKYRLFEATISLISRRVPLGTCRVLGNLKDIKIVDGLCWGKIWLFKYCMYLNKHLLYCENITRNSLSCRFAIAQVTCPYEPKTHRGCSERASQSYQRTREEQIN